MTTAAKKSQPASPRVEREGDGMRYPERWHHKSIGEQVQCFLSGELSPEFRRLNASSIDAIVSRDAARGEGTDEMDGWIVHPKPSRLAGSGTGAREWPTVSRALSAVVRLFARREYGFVDMTEGNVGPEHYRLSKGTADAFAALEERFPGDFLVYRGQTGLRRRTTASVARASLATGEFGLDALAIGCFLLIHPERLVGLEALGVDCIGSEYRRSPAEEFALSPAWVCFDGSYGVGLGLSNVNHSDHALGCASGLVPR